MRFPWRKRSPKKEQACWCYCPTCGIDQVSSGSFVEDTDLVRYTCSGCGTKTEWNFDIAPVPILFTVNGDSALGWQS